MLLCRPRGSPPEETNCERDPFARGSVYEDMADREPLLALKMGPKVRKFGARRVCIFYLCGTGPAEVEPLCGTVVGLLP